jgi:Tfp pilus assembly protein PilF
MLVMAEAFLKQGKHELTQTVTGSALAVDPKLLTPEETGRAHNLKGFAYLAADKQNLATQSFRRAAEADAKNATAWNNLGAQYLRIGNFKTAIECFAYATRLDSSFYKAHLNLGNARRAQGELQTAEKSYQLALQLRPDYPEAFFTLGVLYLDATDYPGLDTTTRLNRALAYFTKYRERAAAVGGSEGDRPGDDVARVKTTKGPEAPRPKAGPGQGARVHRPGRSLHRARPQRPRTREEARRTQPEAGHGRGPPAQVAPGEASPRQARGRSQQRLSAPGEPRRSPHHPERPIPGHRPDLGRRQPADEARRVDPTTRHAKPAPPRRQRSPHPARDDEAGTPPATRSPAAKPKPQSRRRSPKRSHAAAICHRRQTRPTTECDPTKPATAKPGASAPAPRRPWPNPARLRPVPATRRRPRPPNRPRASPRARALVGS